MYRTCKTILITGASSGLGAALARLYAAPDITLGLLARNTVRLNEVADACRKKGARVETGIVDVRDRQHLERWILTFDQAYPIELLIANAGITRPLTRREIHEPVAELDQVLYTNLAGVLNSVFPVVERMQLRRQGHIAVVSSLSAYHGIPAFPAYSASKAALLNYFQAIRGRLSQNGIALTMICPGYITTPMLKNLTGMKLLLLPVDRAAAIIKQGIERGKPLLAFPLSLRIGLWFLGCLPVAWSNWIINKMFGIATTVRTGVSH